MAVVSILTFPFFPRSLHRQEKSTRWASPLAWHRCRRAEKLFSESEAVLCGYTYVFSQTGALSVAPLGPPHHHTDPCASNVNNPAFPGRRGGPSVKERGGRREIPRDSTLISQHKHSCGTGANWVRWRRPTQDTHRIKGI